MNNAMKNHLGILSRLNGGNGSTKYDYIISQDELVSSWVKAHNDLGYPLKKESARDRYLIYNKPGLEAQINKILSDLMSEQASIMVDLLKQDSALAIQDMLDSVNCIGGNLAINPKSLTKSSNNFASRLGRLAGTAIAKATTELLKLIEGED